jgi:hypothetical protein
MSKYKNLSTAGARDNMGGASVVALYAPISYFVDGGIKTRPIDSEDLEARVTISQTHVFKAGKGFHKIRCILDTNKLKADPVGERGGRGIKEEYEAKVSGNTKLMAALMAMFKNDEFVVLIPTHDGLFVQLGSEYLPAEILPSHDTGTIESGVNSMMVKITNYTMSRTFYAGAIQYAPTDDVLGAKVNILAPEVDDEVNLRIDGNLIATAKNETGDTAQDFTYKLYLSLNELGLDFGIQASMEFNTLDLRAAPMELYNWLGQAVAIEVVAGTPTVVSTTLEQTFQPI